VTGERRSNAFDLLRIVGVLLVVVEHSWVLAGHGIPIRFFDGVGTGVGIFFVVSGYLITESWLRDPSPRHYATKRFLRIYPCYLLVITAAALVLGPLVTTLRTGAYFADPQTWRYLVANLFILPMKYDLPGVFSHVPEAHVVNGSLWTLRLEVLCYGAVALLGLTGLLRRRLGLLAVAVGGTVLSAVVHATGYTGNLVPHLLVAGAAEPLTFFALGMLARIAFPAKSPPWWISLSVFTAWIVLWHTAAGYPLALAAIVCLTLTVAFRSPEVIHHPTGRFDLSYGAYVLAYPVQQLLVGAGLHNPWLVLPATLAIVSPLALSSWILVERPALHLKQCLTTGANPRTPRVELQSQRLTTGANPRTPRVELQSPVQLERALVRSQDSDAGGGPG
jgi:peptidoglycan/LPS O-acetylase OafA/YrhL